MTLRIVSICTLLALTALLLVGCGTGNNALRPASATGNTGRAVLTIKWPALDRLIPVASSSIKITITKVGGFSTSQTVARPTNVPPTSTVTFNDLPTGDLSVTASAYPLANAAGIAQATGTAPETISAGQTTYLTLIMNSTITQVLVTPVTPTVVTGGVVTLTATPENIDNNIVLVALGNITWSSSDLTVATVDRDTGVVTALKAGSTTITAKEFDSQKTGSTIVTINTVGVTINPKTATLFATGTQQLTAIVNGALNTNVTWAVQEGSAGGTVSSTGLYTAPAAPGIYHVTATSVADPTKLDTSTITVTHLGPDAVNLGAAGNFAILAGQTVTNTGPTIVNGNLGVSPGTAVSGFDLPGGPGFVINGAIFTGVDPTVAAAKLALTNAANDAAGRALNVIIVPTGELGGSTLAPGLYQSGISSFAITSVDLTLDAQGDSTAVWIFQMPSSTLTVGNGRKVILTNGALPQNIYWQVGSSATLGTSSDVSGNILAYASITLETGAKLHGRALTQIAAVSLDSNTVTKP